MGFSFLCLIFVSIYILSIFVLFHLVVANSLQSYTTTCHDDEISALLQFKQSFVIDKFASEYEGAYPKTASWKSAGNQTSNCCSWDGVECDEKTGHVVGLDLNSSCLYGFINSNNSLFRLAHLQSLNLADNHFNFSRVPTSIRNFPRLRYLNLSLSVFSGQIPYEVSQLSKLSSLDLSYNDGMFSNEELLTNLAQNLTSLETVDLSSINISSTIPNTLANLSLLTSLRLDDCDLFGQLPARIFKLQNLKVLRVSSNPDLMGYFPEFNASSSPLVSLKLASTAFFVNLSSLIENFDSLKELDVSACNISEGPIPFSLGNLRHLIYLDLSGNNFHGQIPFSLGNLIQLTYLSLNSNNFHGQIPSSFGNLTLLSFLDLSNNKLIGILPQCLGTFSDHLEYLNLGNNSFRGILPQTFTNRSNLRMIDVSHNQLQGKLPRSLANCSKLEFLVLSNNEFNHVFPFWLATLPNLRVLAMRHNRFHGGIGKPKMNLHFPELLILDLSHNNFTGEFPSEYIFSGNAMRGDISIPYMKDTDYNGSVTLHDGYYFRCSITITSKGIEINYPKIQDDLAVVDISSNRFEGRIPEFIGNLKRLRSLNISNNNLTGCIPSSLGNLTLLESLDLSQNKLSGQIPQQLKKISFLEKFNVSHNNLTGPILSGTQFNTFDITSYEGNPGLCGDPLPMKCGNPEGTQLPPTTTEENDSGYAIEWDWKFVLAGLGSGLVVGVVLADVAITRWNEWFIEIVAVLSRIVKRMRRPRNRVIHQTC